MFITYFISFLLKSVEPFSIYDEDYCCDYAQYCCYYEVTNSSYDIEQIDELPNLSINFTLGSELYNIISSNVDVFTLAVSFSTCTSVVVIGLFVGIYQLGREAVNLYRGRRLQIVRNNSRSSTYV